MDAMMPSMRPMKESTISSAGRDIDQYAFRLVLDNLLGKIVLQRQGQLVVHIYLNGDEQKIAHL